VGLKSLKSLNLTNGYPNNNKNNIVKSKPLELFELAGKKYFFKFKKTSYIFLAASTECSAGSNDHFVVGVGAVGGGGVHL
jgi:hypothetical protein